LSIGRYDVHRHQVIACQTEQPRQVANSATQRETCHTRVAHDALNVGKMVVGTSQKRKRGGVQAKHVVAYPPARSSQRPTIRRRRHPGGIQHRHAPPCSPRPPGCLASTSTGQATPPARTRTHTLGGDPVRNPENRPCPLTRTRGGIRTRLRSMTRPSERHVMLWPPALTANGSSFSAAYLARDHI
jgi:hypothetical protein